MPFDFDTLPDRRSTESAKWRVYDEDVLPMWVADMDFKSPEAVIQAIQDRVAHGVFGYPKPQEALKESVVAWLDRRHGWSVDPEHLIFVPGVVTGFNLAAHTAAQPGDGVLVQTPTYGPFLKVADNVKLIQQENELIRGEDGQYAIDLDAFEAAINEKTRIFMLCNPQNPTGRVFRKDELEAMAEICLRHNVIICSDEIHGDLVFSESKHIPIALLDPEIAANTITLLAPSKTFNIAGLKASIAVIENDELRQQYEIAKQGLVGWVNLLGQVATQASYEKGAAWLDALLEYLQSNRDYVHDFVEEQLPGISMANPEGTYLAWLDCKGMDIEDKPCDFFMENARVAMNDGDWFGAGGEGHIRFNFGAPRSLVKEALEKMKEAIATL
ncbi:MAG: pyridoxal phosphate-dependent aminotransferase [Anaerolineales bacterium]|nr:pyridoxal phosphate-dependent aminotransferase [Chloroflexota bacterium]MBL6983430.1 pyridoxal phosphate-dependent aminotransferase [Anaerolineales bacterium]